MKEQAKNKTITKRLENDKIALDVARNNGVIPSTMYGRIKNGMSIENSVKNNNYRIKKVQQIDIETGKVISVHKSLRAAARSVHKSPSDISLCANGKLNKAYGYTWKFEDNQEDIKNN